MPIAYHGFGPAAFLIILVCFLAKQLYDHWKRYQQKF